MIILVDQDGPLADFEKGFLETWRAQFPEERFIPLNQRKTFYVRDDYPEKLRDKVESIYFASGFYQNLPPVAGSVEALKILVELGYDVRICTSPLSRYENCVLEKYRWVEKHLGRDFIKRIVLSKDKTIVRGSFLIDDKPIIKGGETAEWEHILYDCPYNQEVKVKRRLTWANWREVFTF
ncbi:MAG: 5'-3'-deoxyribonucleotidase [Candidatus Harrisonbacteria bacterium]|nr:5'-3'-deoxyribonucleotidase [Candidatus Harrisonbacteria bacterium]